MSLEIITTFTHIGVKCAAVQIWDSEKGIAAPSKVPAKFEVGKLEVERKE